MEEKTNLKLCRDDFEVEFEIFQNIEEPFRRNLEKHEIAKGLSEVTDCISTNKHKIENSSKEIERLTNHADGVDYMVAVGSGILAGLIDSFWVGAFDFGSGKAWSNKHVNTFVMKVAKNQGYNGNRLDGAIKFLEDKFKIASDNIWKGKDAGISAKSHHLDDLAHHPTPIGLFFSVLSQFTKKGYFQNGEGASFAIPIDENVTELVGENIPCKICAGTINWFFHLVSDMSGSKKTAGVGMGIPGPILSLAKEISAISGFNPNELTKKIKNAFITEKFDLRSELAVAHELGRQAIPVILNEVIVRTFYFIRRLVLEIKEKKNIETIDWSKTIPRQNRTIVRMLTIATGTFTLIDLTDATIRGINPLFPAEFLLYVNFIGVGRFAVALGADVSMGLRRSRLSRERMAIYAEQLHLMNAKIFYCQADVWIAAETTEKTIQDALKIMERTSIIFKKSIQETSENLEKIGKYIPDISQMNPNLIEEMNNILEE